ncbi:hypothetical protein INT48_005864 [Thamnidium elegans]|uniref:Uncharacterized protein n=1 Tax=Thamnidium elegans TaxID=101142 RepID=A0A8H7VU19_9FUNG|nr:hypothetical protein INT48_005864 [Thamnidium elegans]
MDATNISDNRPINPDQKSNSSIRPARLFALFPMPGLRWRFIKIDTKNINSFAPQNYSSNLNYDTALGVFYNTFDFTKIKNLNIKSLEDSINLHQTKNTMFINEVKTDGYTCNFTFAKKSPVKLQFDSIQLEISDFGQKEVDTYFRPCTVDPGRSHAFTGYYDDNEIRRLSTKNSIRLEVQLVDKRKKT